MVGDRVAQLAPQAEQELVGVVGADAELVGDLGRVELVAELEVEDARVALAECGGRRPHQLPLVPGVADRLGGEHPVGTDEVVTVVAVVAVVEAGHDVTLEGLGPTVLLEPVEGPVAAGAEQPAAEAFRVVELVEALPRREEDVLGDLGGGVVVADDVAGDVVDPVEPALEEGAERRRVAAGCSAHEGCVAVVGSLRRHRAEYCRLTDPHRSPGRVRR